MKVDVTVSCKWLNRYCHCKRLNRICARVNKLDDSPRCPTILEDVRIDIHPETIRPIKER